MRRIAAVVFGVEYGAARVVVLLVAAGAEVDAKNFEGTTSLILAAGEGEPGLAGELK